jgi:hypothetical protein
MANGSAALHLVPASESENTSAPRAGIEVEIGIAVANACEAFGVALAEENIPMRAETRTLNGEKLAVLVELWLAHLGEVDDFRGLAQRAGCSALLERHGKAIHQLLGAGVPETTITECIGELCGLVLGVANEVAAVESVMRAN